MRIVGKLPQDPRSGGLLPPPAAPEARFAMRPAVPLRSGWSGHCLQGCGAGVCDVAPPRNSGHVSKCAGAGEPWSGFRWPASVPLALLLAGSGRPWLVSGVPPAVPDCPGCAARDEQIAGLREELRAQAEQAAELRERVARLERALSRNSQNSSMPPSGDDVPGRKPPRKQRRAAEREAGKRNRGKQPGAPGSAMCWAEPDDTRDHFPRAGAGAARPGRRAGSGRGPVVPAAGDSRDERASCHQGTEACRTLNSALFGPCTSSKVPGLSDRFGSANLPGAVRVTALAVRRALSARSVTLPV